MDYKLFLSKRMCMKIIGKENRRAHTVSTSRPTYRPFCHIIDPGHSPILVSHFFFTCKWGFLVDLAYKLCTLAIQWN